MLDANFALCSLPLSLEYKRLILNTQVSYKDHLGTLFQALDKSVKDVWYNK